MKVYILPVVLLIFLMRNSFAEEIHISSEVLEQKDSIYIGKGNVRLKKQDTTLSADEVVYNHNTAEAELTDNVFYEDPEITIRAEKASINLDEETGVLYDAEVFVKKDNYHLRAEEIKKFKGKRYHLKNVTATTCDGELPAWCLKGRSADIILGDRLSARDISLRIKGIPVLYTPYIWAPLLTERKTGFLFPTVGYSTTKGLYLKQPFFWAIRENRDATFSLDIYSKRGIGKSVEYRYIERMDIKGNLYLYHIRDSKLNRDFIEIRAVHEHGRDYEPIKANSMSLSGYININVLNHREFPRIYKPYLEERSMRFLESNLGITKPLKNSRLYLRGDYLIELKEGIRQGTISQRLPEVGFLLNPLKAGPIRLSLNSSVTNFFRETDEHGQRITFNARLSHTLGERLTFSQIIGIKETLYHLTEDSYSIEAVDYKAVLQTRFIRSYSRLTHAITPSISYRYLFQQDNSTTLFDSAELKPPQSITELSLLSRLMDEKGEVLSIRVVESLDSREGNNLDLGLHLRRPILLKSSANYDIKEGRFETASSELTLKVLSRWVGTIGESYSRQVDLLLHTLGVAYTHSKALSLEAKLWYDSKRGQMQELTGEIRWRRQCWGMNLSVIRRPHDLSVFLTINLMGLGSFKA